MIVRGIGSNGNNRLKPFNSRGRRRQGQGPVKRSPGHPDLSGRPKSLHRFLTLQGRVAGRLAGQPLHHRLGCQRFVFPSNGGTAFGKPGSRRG